MEEVPSLQRNPEAWELLSQIPRTPKASVRPEDFVLSVQKKINNHWRKIKKPTNRRYRAIYQFEVFRDGHFEDIELITSSGSQQYDESALQAIQRTEPVTGFPEDWAGETMTMQMTFNLSKLISF